MWIRFSGLFVYSVQIGKLSWDEIHITNIWPLSNHKITCYFENKYFVESYAMKWMFLKQYKSIKPGYELNHWEKNVLWKYPLVIISTTQFKNVVLHTILWVVRRKKIHINMGSQILHFQDTWCCTVKCNWKIFFLKSESVTKGIRET